MELHSLEVLERERMELRRKRDEWTPVITAAVRLVCSPAWAGVSDEDVELERALRDAGLVTPNV